MGAIADRPDCSLLTALTIFHGAEPYSEYKADKWYDVPIFEMITRIHDRINAGGYKHNPADHRREMVFNPQWHLGQQDGDTTRKVGHWQLDPRIVLPACIPPPKDPNEPPTLSASQEARAQDLFLDLNGDDQAKQRMAAMALVTVDAAIQWRVGKLMDDLPKAKKSTIGGIIRGLFRR